MTNRCLTPILLMAVAGPLFADVALEFETRKLSEPTLPAVTTLIQSGTDGKLVKWNVPGTESSNDSTLIYNLEHDDLLAIDHDLKSFQHLNRESAARLAERLEAGQKRVREVLARLPEEEREKLEQRFEAREMRRQSPLPAPEAQKTDETSEQQGYPCVKYTVTRGDLAIGEMWVTDWSRIPDGEKVAAALRGVTELTGILTSSRPSQRPDRIANSIIDELVLAEGLPVVIRALENGEPVYERRLMSVDEEPAQPGAFDPPEGYAGQIIPGTEETALPAVPDAVE